MTEPPYERHPLDDDPDEADVRPRADRPTAGRDMAQAYQPLLRASKYILIGCGAIVFLSGVAASNAQPNSGFEATASAVNRLSIMGLLCGFVMLLIAYRIPHMQIYLGDFAPLQSPDLRKPRSSASPSSTSSMNHGAIQSAISSASTRSTSVATARSTRRNASGIELLLIINAMLLGVIWATVAFSPTIIYGALLLIYLAVMVISMGLLVTMIIWNKGWLKAYAVGTLVAIVPVLFWSLSSIRMMGLGGGWESTLAAGTLMSLPLLTGLACAGYVYVLALGTDGASSPPPIRKYAFVELPIKHRRQPSKNRSQQEKKEPPRLPPEAQAETN